MGPAEWEAARQIRRQCLRKLQLARPQKVRRCRAFLQRLEKKCSGLVLRKIAKLGLTFPEATSVGNAYPSVG